MGTYFKIVINGTHSTLDFNYWDKIFELLKSKTIIQLIEDRGSWSYVITGVYLDGFVQDIPYKKGKNLLLWMSEKWGLEIKARSITTNCSDEEYLIYNKGVVEKEDTYVIFDDEVEKVQKAIEKF